MPSWRATTDRGGFLVVLPAVVISSLYPVVPALLGIYVLRERLSPLQVQGLGLAVAAVMLIATG